MITLTLTKLIATIILPLIAISLLVFYLIRRYLTANHHIHLLNFKIEQLQEAKQEETNQLEQTSAKYREMETKFNEQNISHAALQERLNLLAVYQNRNGVLEKELDELRNQHNQQFAELSKIKTRLEETRLSADEKLQLLSQSEARLTEQFENLATRIFSHNSKKMEEQNSHSLQHLLAPLKDQLENFKKQVQDSFGQEAKERHTLTHEIRNLQQLNTQMAKEAVNLTNALKGNNKIQGTWGEIILNRILDSSGLRKNYEYETQVNLQNEVGKKQQPDVIVHLPQGHDVIIDAKVVLTAYERYFNSENEQEKENAMHEHLTAVRQHIKQLSDKNYHKLLGIRSLDYILMFIPVEPAFLAAIDRDPALIDEALKHNIMLVSQTTLLVSLRTIHNLWQYEYQNRHAQDIAEKAAKLYDKMRGFVDDMENLGTHIKRSEKTYNEAMTKLSKGRGNAIGQIEQFRCLGISVKKPISKTIAEAAFEEFLGSGEELPDKVSNKANE